MTRLLKKPAIAFVKMLKQMHEIKCSDENCEKCADLEAKLAELE